MGTKSLRIALKNDRVEQAEALMLRIEKIINAKLSDTYTKVCAIDEGVDLVYESLLDLKGRTWRGRWVRLKAWLQKH